MENAAKIRKQDIENILALTPVQEGMLFHNLKDPLGGQYREELRLRLSGDISHSLFEEAWQHVVSSNEMLRTVFRWEGVKQPVQLVLKQHRPRLLFTEEQVSDDKGAYDLQNVPFTVELCTLGNGEYEMVIRHHHILLDGWSNGVLLREFVTAYRQLAQCETPSFKQKPKFKEYIRWLQAQDNSRQQAFWNSYLEGLTEQAPFSIKKKGEERGSRACTYTQELGKKRSQELRTFARSQGVTLTTLFYAAWGVLQQRYQNERDVLFGTTVSGRTSELPGSNEVIGLFINTLPLRVKHQDGQTVANLLRDVQRGLQARTEQESTPLVEIGASFDTLLVVENYPLDTQLLSAENGHFKVTGYKMREMTNYDLTVAIECFDSAKVVMTWPEGLFDEAAIERCTTHFVQLLSEMAENSSRLVDELKMLFESEQAQMLEMGNGADAEWPDVCIHQLFEQQVQLHPDQIALRTEEETLTYAELNQCANRMARVLRGKGVGPGAVVGLTTERSALMYVALFAILKAGGAYMPIAPHLPLDRAAYMLEESKPVLLLASEQHSAAYQDLCEVLVLESSECNEGSSENLNVDSRPDQLAYVLYTSGSTGRPKGVEIEHRSVINRLLWMQQSYPIGRGDVILQKTPYTFDVSVWELFWWSFVGASLSVLALGAEGNPKRLLATIKHDGVTVMHFVPSMLQVFLDYVESTGANGDLASLKQVFASGEALGSQQVETFRRLRAGNTKLINMYGPTEATVDVTHYDCENHPAQQPVPIGRPIDNISLYVRSVSGQLQPVGVPGELCIGGVGVARGYLNQPELTDSLFVQDPWNSDSRIYRTGDLVRWLPDGTLDYLGRLDHQVKIRGFRIELGEIEHGLLQVDGISEAVVCVLGEASEDRRLVAYVVAKGEFDEVAVKAALSKHLPSYMIPQTFVQLERMPLTANGKADRKTLPHLSSKQAPRQVDATLGELEQQIAVIWQEVLGVEKAGLYDNFFELGGNSLKMIRLLSSLSRSFEQEISMPTLFRYPTVQELARYYRGEHEEVETDETLVPRERSENGDVAVVGMAVRVPGASNVEAFWTNLRDGVEGIRFFTDEELSEAGIPSELLQKPNYVKAKGYLEDGDAFDNKFFEYGPKEAEMMDPQLRLLHEVAWEALEHAGEIAASNGSNVGVYVGGSPNFHWLRNIAGEVSSALDEFQAMLLNEKDFFATRLAYKLNLTGPGVTVQTACSTSLVAIELAWTDLKEGRCNMALAGGVSVTYPSKTGYLYEDGMILSPDGHCRAFDEQAAGTVGGNGAGIVVLKRLEDAVRDGNTIYGVIKGAAVNNDGSRKAGFTAPSVDGQVAVIRAAQKVAGVTSADISYVETHGTGTQLGDPIEIEALKLAFGGQEAGSVWIGSVKTNVGHLDAAAGVVGFVKTVLSLHHAEIPASLHYERPNPKIDFGKNPFRVNTALIPWKQEVRRAGVSSFGMGGTNAHVIVEQAPVTQAGEERREWKLLTLSAKSEEALEQATDRLAQHLEAHPESLLSDVAYTLHVGRRSFPHRRAIVASGVQEVLELLKKGSWEITQAAERRPVAFLFTGQGAQYVNMAKGLYKNEPVFREQLDQGLTLLTQLLGFEVRDVLYPPQGEEEAATERLNRTELTQPMLFIVEHALASLLMAWGVRPQQMIGHSIGEYMAACLAGVMSYEDAVRLVALRGRLMQSLPAGSMLGVNVPEAEIVPFLSDELALAAVNSPTHVVISGPTSAIEALEQTLTEHGMKATRLHTSHAFHSPMMDPILGEFEREMAKVNLSAPKTPYLSNVTGTWITAEEATTPAYWAKQLRGKVDFSGGLSELFRTEDLIFLEFGPGRVLSTFVQSHPERLEGHIALPLLRHPMDTVADEAHLLGYLSRFWMLGGNVDWTAFYQGEQRRLIALPTYPFERCRFSVDLKAALSTTNRPSAGKRYNIDEWFYVPSWERAPLPVKEKETLVSADDVWMLFIDRHDHLTPLVKFLAQDEHRVLTVRQGEWFERVDENSYTIHPREKADYEALCADLERRGLTPRKIVHTWCLNGLEQMMLMDRVEQTLDEGYYSLLYLAQALGRREYQGGLQLYAVTDSMQEVTGSEDLKPDQATILGFTKICGLEFPNLLCRSVDVDLQSPISFLDALLQELMSDAKDLVVAIRGRHRWVKTMKSLPFEQDGTLVGRLREGGVYLITGGLGGIGFTIAKDLARTVAGVKLVLLGRTAFPDREEWDDWLTSREETDRTSTLIHALREMEAFGAEVLVQRADVANEADMRTVLHNAKEKFGQINGVIHAAGVGDYLGIMMNRTKEQNDAILAPKVQGTLVLDHVLKNEPLDFLVLCSSIGNIAYHQKFGQSGYSAANEFLDAFAFYKNAHDGVFTVAINWPDWQDVGMSLGSAETWAKMMNTTVEAILHDGLSADEGVEVFRRILRQDHYQVVVSPEDLLWKLEHGAAHFVELLEQGSQNKKKQERSDVLTAFTAPTNEIEQQLCELWQTMFGLTKVGIHDNFFDLGLSSLDIVRVTSKLKEIFKRDIPVVALYEHSSIHALAKSLAHKEQVAEQASRKEELNKAKSVMKNTLARLGKR